jgi:hypothetical protein
MYYIYGLTYYSSNSGSSENCQMVPMIAKVTTEKGQGKNAALTDAVSSKLERFGWHYLHFVV